MLRLFFEFFNLFPGQAGIFANFGETFVFFRRLGDKANMALKLPGNPVVDSGGDPSPALSKIYVGSNHSCAPDSDGGVWCWGAFAPSGTI